MYTLDNYCHILATNVDVLIECVKLAVLFCGSDLENEVPNMFTEQRQFTELVLGKGWVIVRSLPYRGTISLGHARIPLSLPL